MNDDLHEKLKSNVMCVKFTKVDGSEREMACTLIEEKLPPRTEADTMTNSRSKNEDVQVVFDLEKNAWRSFRKDRVISYHVKENV